MKREFIHESTDTGSRLCVAARTADVCIVIGNGSAYGPVLHLLKNTELPELIEVLQSALAEKEDET